MYLEEKVKDNTRIIIANKNGYPPSLPFYLKTRFTAVDECYNQQELMEHYKSSKACALILPKGDKDWFEQQNVDMVFYPVSSLMTDRKETANYYISYNTNAKK